MSTIGFETNVMGHPVQKPVNNEPTLIFNLICLFSGYIMTKRKWQRNLRQVQRPREQRPQRPPRPPPQNDQPADRPRSVPPPEPPEPKIINKSQGRNRDFRCKLIDSEIKYLRLETHYKWIVRFIPGGYRERTKQSATSESRARCATKARRTGTGQAGRNQYRTWGGKTVKSTILWHRYVWLK